MTNEAHRAVLDNARRLHADAQLLFENERYPTALSISILAWEEVGKIYLYAVDWEKESPQDRPKDNHVEKQRLAHTLELAELGLPVVQQYLVKMGFPDEVGLAEAMVVALATNPDDPIFHGKGKQFLDELTAVVAAGLRGTEAAQVHNLIMKRSVDAQKQRGFYCDIAGGSIKSNPASVTREQASEFLEAVARALAFMNK